MTPEQIAALTFNQVKDAIKEQNALCESIENRYEDGQEWKKEDETALEEAVNLLEALNTRRGEFKAEELKQRRAVINASDQVVNAVSGLSALNAPLHTRPAWESDENYGYNSLPEYLLDTREAIINGPENASDQWKALNAVGSDEYSRSDFKRGGALIPKGFLSTVMQTEADIPNFTGMMTNIPMSTTSIDIPARVDKDHSTSVTGGTIAYRQKEANTVNLTRDAMERVSLKTNELFVASAATEQVLRDSPISIAAMISASAGTALQYKIAEEFFDGSGVGTGLGIHTAANECKLALDRQSGQADAVIVSGEDILEMRKRVYRYGQAIWLANIDLYDTIYTLAIESANNAGIVKNFYQEADGDLPATLLGRPIYFTEFAPGATANAGAAITDWSTGLLSCVNLNEYLYGTRGGQRNSSSVHVRFLQGEEVFKFVMENDFRPWWKSVLTPKNGLSTQSPVVYLTNTSTAA